MFGKDKANNNLKDNLTSHDFKFNLGDVVKDTITGFKGVVVYRSQWLNGCNTYGVKPQDLKDGAPQKSEHLDEPQLLLDERGAHEPQRATGGPERPLSATTGV